MELIDPFAALPSLSQWRVLLQTMGKAGKGTAWAEYKLESIINVPSLISESVIMEDDEEGSTPGSTPAKDSPRLLRHEDLPDNMRRIGHSLLRSVCEAAPIKPSPARKADVTLRQVGEGDEEPPETTPSSRPAPLDPLICVGAARGREVEEEIDVGENDAVEDKLVLEKAPVVDPAAAAEEESTQPAVHDRQDAEPAATKTLTDDEAEAERMMAETNALVFECGYTPYLVRFRVLLPPVNLTAARRLQVDT